MAISEGPEAVLDWVDARFHVLLGEVGRGDQDVRGIGIGVPGPVEHATGRPRNPPIMPGWDGYPIPERFADRYPVPVLVDNDVNIMALGEHWTTWRQVEHLLFVKVATGIGCGVVVDGRIHRGAEGAAGRHRAHPRRRRRRTRAAHLQLRQPGVPRGDGGRRRDGRAAARPGARGARLTRRGRARQGRRARGRSHGPRLRAADRRGARRLGQPLQPVGDRDRRRRRPGRTSSSWPGSARSSISARCRWRRDTCGSCAASSPTGPA